MSSRRAPAPSVQAIALRAELEAAQKVALAQATEAVLAPEASLATTPVPEALAATAGATPTFEQLSTTEQAAGSLGVVPNEWKPIQFMNTAHYDALLKSNSMDDTLVRRIAAFQKVAASEDAA